MDSFPSFKYILIFICICVFTTLLYTRFKRNSTPLEKSRRDLIVGTATGYAPFVSIDSQGTYEGFDIDIAHELAQILNKNLVLKDLGSMTSLIIALNQGIIDAIIWGISITQERLQKFAFVPYQGTVTTSYPLIFWNTPSYAIDTLDDMKGRTIAVEPGSSQSMALEKYRDIIILPTEKVDDALLALEYGKADAAFVEPLIAHKFKAKFPSITTHNIALDPADYVYGIGIVLKKNNTILHEQITHAITRMRQEGTIAILEKKWGLI